MSKYRYYLTQRPPSLGTFPSGVEKIVCYDYKKRVMEIGKKAYGYVEYDFKLTADDIEYYELVEVIK